MKLLGAKEFLKTVKSGTLFFELWMDNEEDYLDYQIKEKNYKKTRTTKKVYQLLKDKTIVAIYPSALAAYKAISGKNNAKSAEAIKGCCQGLRKSAYNYF